MEIYRWKHGVSAMVPGLLIAPTHILGHFLESPILLRLREIWDRNGQASMMLTIFHTISLALAATESRTSAHLQTGSVGLCPPLYYYCSQQMRLALPVSEPPPQIRAVLAGRQRRELRETWPRFGANDYDAVSALWLSFRLKNVAPNQHYRNTLFSSLAPCLSTSPATFADQSNMRPSWDTRSARSSQRRFY